MTSLSWMLPDFLGESSIFEQETVQIYSVNMVVYEVSAVFDLLFVSSFKYH